MKIHWTVCFLFLLCPVMSDVLQQKEGQWGGFSGGSVVKNPPANAGDMG